MGCHIYIGLDIFIIAKLLEYAFRNFQILLSKIDLITVSREEKNQEKKGGGGAKGGIILFLDFYTLLDGSVSEFYIYTYI
jgi:hypothetical protein